MVRRNGFISLTGLMLALGLLLLYLGLGLTAGQRSRSHQAVDGLAREMALDMQQVRQRCVGNNQSNGRWKLVLEEKRYVLQEGYIRVKERPPARLGRSAARCRGTGFTAAFTATPMSRKATSGSKNGPIRRACR